MKKICVHLFFALMQHIKFQVLSSSGSLVLLPTKGVIKRRTNRRTGPNQYALSASSKLGASNCRHWLIELCLSLMHCFFHSAMYVIHNLVFV